LRNTNCYSDWGEELRYFFFRYEEYLAQEQGQNFKNEQWERIWAASAADSIEHIWAQSKAPEPQVHRLGNLTLLPPKLNSKLRALDPGKKRDAYIKTGLLIDEQVASKLRTSWKQASIDEREKILLDWAAKEWGWVAPVAGKRGGPNEAMVASKLPALRHPPESRMAFEPAFPGWYRILQCNGSDYYIGYNMLSGIERGSHGGPGG
jgi:hypothetical protein